MSECSPGYHNNFIIIIAGFGHFDSFWEGFDMPVTMGGMASGMDTDGLIEKLVEVEARPIQQWVADRNRSNQRKEALGVLRTNLTELNNSVKDLYGFRASFKDKKAISSDAGIVNAVANKEAEKGSRSILVKELASTHKIATDPLKKDYKIPAGKIKIEVNGESEIIGFRGGNLESFKERIDEIASDLITTMYLKTNDDNYVLSIESKVPGKKGEILLSGDKDFIKSIGLVNGEKGESKDKVDIVFDRKYFTSYLGDQAAGKQDGSFDIGNNGASIEISGVLWNEYLLPLESPVTGDTVLEFEIDYKEKEVPGADILPSEINVGPEDTTIIKGIELHSYNITRTRALDKQESKKEISDVFGIGVISVEKGNRIEKIYRLDKGSRGKQVIPIGNDFSGKNISKIIFYCNEGKTVFSGTALLTPVRGTGALQPKNEITKAGDAKLNVDGIEVVRDKNSELNDIIKGLSISLRGVSGNPIIITVEPDLEKSINKIKGFVKAYNDYLEINKSLTRAEKTSKPDDYNNIKDKSGLFVGDMTILRLENYLKRSVGEAYPSRASTPVKILSQTGVSTGEVNAEWESIREGKLVVDEDKLRNVVSENPDGVTEFFGSDTDGDSKIDNGLAYRMEYILKPYLVAGNNVLVSMVKLEEGNMSGIDEKINKHKDHLKKYEEKLRIKFTAMERSISGSKAQRAWMQNQLGGLQDSDNNTPSNKR
ncbi:MAG: flagellar filament capping protein FliD [Spirochaetes bacterium]|nr:flagellar filament capping protein FliD [Spirochaetota bacterium]